MCEKCVEKKNSSPVAAMPNPNSGPNLMRKSIRSLTGKPGVDEYLTAALGVEKWFNKVAIREGEQVYWPQLPNEGFSEGEPIFGDYTVNRGYASIVLYYIELYKATLNKKYLAEAEKGADYIIATWKPEDEVNIFLNVPNSNYGYYYGAAGIAQLFWKLHNETDKQKYYDFVYDTTNSIVNAAVETPNGITWADNSGFYIDGGTALYLLEIGKELGDQAFFDAGVKAVNHILSKAIRHENGSFEWLGQIPGAGEGYYSYPNYELGTSGVAYLLAKAYSLTKDERYLEAAEGGVKYLQSIAFTPEDDVAYIPLRVPDMADIYYLGFCNGSVGSTRVFYELYKITGEEKYKEWLLKLANGITAAGAPEYNSPGYWYNDTICCGTAGIGLLFLGLYHAFGDETYLEVADRSAFRILSNVDYREDGTAQWPGAFTRATPWVITEFTGYFSGAAGIGSFLLDLALVKQGRKPEKRSTADPSLSFFLD